MLSVVVALKVSFPLNLLRGERGGKKEREREREQSSKKNPAERGPRRGRGREEEEDEWWKNEVICRAPQGTDVYVPFFPSLPSCHAYHFLLSAVGTLGSQTRSIHPPFLPPTPTLYSALMWRHMPTFVELYCLPKLFRLYLVLFRCFTMT